MTGVCGGVGSGAVVVVDGDGGGGGGRDGWRMAPLGRGTTAIGTDCEPGGGPLSVDDVTCRTSQLLPSRSGDMELTPYPLSHLARSVAVRHANSAI